MIPFRALQQPLVSRPSYGQRQELAESGLPQGDPGGKGIGLSPDIPGEATYSKPVNDLRRPDKAPPGSIYRKDGPDDLAKPQDDPEGDERHHEQFKPRFTPPGGRPPDSPIMTDYPYRDGLPHQHYATTREQAEFVLGMFLVESAHSLRVSPESRLFIASKPDEILAGLNPKFQERSKRCAVTVKRVDANNLRWLFSVDAGNGPKVVKLKAFRAKNVVRLGKMDVDVTCSCPAWQWLGPEHHAKREEYLDGSPRGTASVPVIRDPEGINRVCKHVAAVLSFVKDWEVPKIKKK
jgi:hypothetical protein